MNIKKGKITKGPVVDGLRMFHQDRSYLSKREQQAGSGSVGQDKALTINRKPEVKVELDAEFRVLA